MVLTCPAEKQLTLCRSWALTNPTAPSTSEITLQYLSLFSLWLSPILCFYTAFLCQSSCFFSLTWAMVGQFLVLLLLLSVLHHCSQFGHESIWPGNPNPKSRHCTCVREGVASSVCTRVMDSSQTLPLALIGCTELGAVDSCKSNYSH